MTVRFLDEGVGAEVPVRFDLSGSNLGTRAEPPGRLVAEASIGEDQGTLLLEVEGEGASGSGRAGVRLRDFRPGVLEPWIRLLAEVSIESGTVDFEADGSLAAIDKFFGVPLMANAKLSLQVWIVEAYGGAGLGAIYNQVDFSAGGSSNDWLFAGNAFLGADAVLFEKLTAGLELKYYLTEENDLGLNADAAAAFLTVGLRF